MQRIILIPDLKASEKTIKTYIAAKNEHLALNKDTYNKEKIKFNILNTAIVILKAYFKHQQMLNKLFKDAEVIEEYKEFIINNHAVATMVGCCPRTAARHIAILKKHNVLINYTFRGSNAGFSIQINPELLVAFYNEDYINLVRTTFMQKLDVRQLPKALNSFIGAARLKFQNSENGVLTFTSCQDIEKHFELEHNNNKEIRGIVNLIDNSPEKKAVEINNACLYLGQEQERKDKPENFVNNQHILSPESPKKEKGLPACPENNDPIKQNAAGYVFYAWAVASGMLWEKMNFPEHTINTVKKFLFYYFSHSLTGKAPDMQRRFNNFVERIKLAKKYVDKSPARFIPNPALYFDPSFKYGFTGTYQWWQDTLEARKKEHRKRDNLDILTKVINLYKDNPTMSNYCFIKQKLDKKKEEGLIDMFDSFIVSMNNEQIKINNAYIKNVYQKYC